MRAGDGSAAWAHAVSRSITSSTSAVGMSERSNAGSPTATGAQADVPAHAVWRPLGNALTMRTPGWRRPPISGWRTSPPPVTPSIAVTP